MRKLLVVCLGLSVTLGAQGKEEDRLRACATVLKEIVDIPDDIPKELLDKAECVIVFPSVKKLAVGVGGSYGRGVMTCRGGQSFDGPWGAPTMIALEGASLGFQLGGLLARLEQVVQVRARVAVRAGGARAALEQRLVDRAEGRLRQVDAPAVRPFGPAAADASAPSLTLLLSTDCEPRSFITRSTKSVASPPSWKPMLPPSSAIMTGDPQAPSNAAPLRQVITPRP